jgi:flagellar motor switch protein FliN/FliY
MAIISEEIVNKLSQLNNQIWQTVSITSSEAANANLLFGSPLTIATTPNDLFSEMAAPKLVIQFVLADMPENSHVILLTQETFLELAALARNVDPLEIQEVDDTLVADARPLLESIVQGLCLGVGGIKNEPLIAQSLSIRFQIFNFPPSLQKSDHVVRTNIAISSDVVNGSLTWIIDSETAQSICGVQANGAVIGQQIDAHEEAIAFAGEDPSSIDILMDIPLDMSVELGRVKMLVKDVIDLGSGSIIEIDKAAGEPVDVLVNGRLVARGEVVVIEDNFGVRITEILSPQERLQRLNDAA